MLGGMFGGQSAVRSGGDEVEEVFLNLTPMIDILTCLLFFLLLGYKSQSLMLEGAKGMELPPSNSDKGLVVSLTVTVTQSELKLMDSHIALLRNGVLDPKDVEGSKILPLYNRMVRILQLKKLDPNNSFVLFLADRRLKADVITKVMKTCGMAGLPNFHFGVARP
jgi:biopolymer transport protein ExbD